MVRPAAQGVSTVRHQQAVVRSHGHERTQRDTRLGARQRAGDAHDTGTGSSCQDARESHAKAFAGRAQSRPNAHLAGLEEPVAPVSHRQPKTKKALAEKRAATKARRAENHARSAKDLKDAFLGQQDPGRGNNAARSAKYPGLASATRCR